MTKKTTSTNQFNQEPWLAVNLSNIFPGLGQIYTGEKIKGYITILLSIMGYLVGAYIAFISPTGNILVAGAIAIVFTGAIWLWSLFDAYSSTVNRNDGDFEFQRKQNKDPWKAMFLSRLLFGIGHFYIGKWVFGLFAVTLIIITLVSRNIITFIIFPILIAWVSYLAYVFAPVHRETSKNLAFAVAILMLIVSFFPLGLGFVMRNYFVESRWIPSGSMEPTLHGTPNQFEADKIMVDKFTYRFQTPQRGDIIIFNATDALQQQGFQEAFIKRIVGLPGEKIALKNGKVYIDGKQLDEAKYLSPNITTSADICSFTSSAPFLATEKTIPNNAYLVLGDNRTQAYDGRCWGVVERQFIIGKAYKRFWPLNKISTL